jgi:hypothetical protein
MPGKVSIPAGPRKAQWVHFSRTPKPVTKSARFWRAAGLYRFLGGCRKMENNKGTKKRSQTPSEWLRFTAGTLFLGFLVVSNP